MIPTSEKSTSLPARAQAVFPAGSNGEFNIPPELSIVIQKGKGCRLWDPDGHEYIDFSMGWGSCLPGHARPEIVDAVCKQAPNGSNFAYISEQALLLAEELISLSPAMEQVRFCASGTEATMYCQRLARAYTGKPKILKFEGAYHGANEIGVTSLFPESPPAYPKPDNTSAGITESVTKDILVAPYNDIETTRKIIEQHQHEIAAVIVEPLQRCTPPRDGFLDALRSITQDRNILLLFDEVVTGFRLAYGGAQEYYGIVPDMVAYGKALSGGYPLGAYGGKKAIMVLVEEHRMNQNTYVWTASSIGGSPISTAAARAALKIYKQPETHPFLHKLGHYLRDGMRQVLHDLSINGQIIGDGPLAQVVFSSEPVFDYRSTKKGDSVLARKLMLELFKKRIFLNPMGTKLYLSLAHDERICDEFLNRFEEGLKSVYS